MLTEKPKLRPRKLRLHVPLSLSEGADVALTADQAHRAVVVMRLADGAPVAAFNGTDGEWRARLRVKGRREVRLEVEQCVRPPRDEPGPWLVFAPLKKDALDMLVEKATELGVECLMPVITDRTVVARVNLDRLRARTVEAAEQCERLTLPTVVAPAPLADTLAAWPAARSLVVLSEHGGPPLADVITAPQTRHASELPPGFLVGPEGGLTASELDLMAALPFVARAALGPRILRAETAALAALAAWQTVAGDGSQPPPPRTA